MGIELTSIGKRHQEQAGHVHFDTLRFSKLPKIGVCLSFSYRGEIVGILKTEELRLRKGTLSLNLTGIDGTIPYVA